MTVKELKKQLKGQYTDIMPFRTDRRDVMPFTMLGADLYGLTGREFDRVFDTKEVVEYKLGEWKKVACWSTKEMKSGTGHYEMHRTLTIYFKSGKEGENDMKEKLDAPSMVLETYLDGAMADMENGDVENIEFIYDCIKGLKKLGDSKCQEYLKRYNEYMKKEKEHEI